MAEIKPFKAWRYNHELSDRISELTSPLFDVVSENHKKKLYENEYNSIHLSTPLEGYQSKSLSARIELWKSKGILVQDRSPTVYVYYQYYASRINGKELCRKGFICDVRIHDWSNDVIFKHEATIPTAVAGRKAVLNDTGLNVSAIHGLYSDPNHELEKYMDEAIKDPIYDTEDYQGVRDVLSRITDNKIIEHFVKEMKERQIILADGHHRYEAALKLRNELRIERPEQSLEAPFEFQMMFLTNTDSEDFEILPTHRLIQNVEGFDGDKFLKALSKYFYVLELEDDADVFQLIAGRRWAFGLYIGDRQFNIRLKQFNQFEMDWDLPDLVKNLDLTVLHYFVIEKVLGITKNKQAASSKVFYERSSQVCLKKVLTGQAHCAFLTQPLTIDTVQEVCRSGYTLPQKSTFFYPKVICGYLFNSIKPEDHE